ncbi:hypothetical protein ACJX0J_037761, partial [Zea mays]
MNNQVFCSWVVSDYLQYCIFIFLVPPRYFTYRKKEVALDIARAITHFSLVMHAYINV